MRKVLMVMAGVALVGAAKPVVKKVDAFNLHCVGTLHRVSGNPLVASTKTPQTRDYRVNMTTKKWCKDSCDYIQDIESIDDNGISLQASGDEGYTHIVSLVRRSGEIDDMFGTPEDDFNFNGICQRQPFTGFPARKF